ncbi:MAG: response regulator, partial [Alphaproteobacteria bacterium]|nr:response regulator [Alphaproteobacteria bacterium]
MDRCVQAGMNGYVSKPFQPNELIVALGAVISGCLAFERAACTKTAVEAIDDIDWNVIENFRADSGEEMLNILLDTYIADTTEKLNRFCAIVADTSRRDEAMRLAHSLKSAGAMSGAKALSTYAARLEKLLHDGEAQPTADDTGELQRSFGAYRSAIAKRGLLTAA